MCSKDHDHKAERNSNCEKSHSCNDIQLELDQFSDKLFSADYAKSFLGFGPAIITLYWVQTNLFIGAIFTSKHTPEETVAFSNSSPPTYLLNRNFRI
ncbi:hypothetical protein FAZ19_04845 [Sphingobacterium alkalisoli]|uniref:Uncharacterized protein n=1 Tax=Sphingobacterium alkalisoli TaxID=1874115 RepID=A0A4U0H9W9_9SPHI|nr:hypothetical protein [Sphingobacterium alkalisoli]TJY68586.1 hypothetical protein FAZ19_04845 [Sphingobacterium alkalisoli]